MKKILSLFAIVGLVAFSSCSSDDDGPDNDTYPVAFEIKNVNLTRSGADNYYKISNTFSNEIGTPLYDDETVLVYRLSDVVDSNTPIWQLIPRTIYFDDDNELDYDYDFSKVDFVISARGTYNLLNKPSYINNQTFRVVVVPSNLLASINKNNYLDVMKTLKLNENQIKQVNF
jgi:hypothetical protein